MALIVPMGERYAFTPSKSTSPQDIVDMPRYVMSTSLPELYNEQAAKGMFSKPNFSNSTDISDIIRQLDGGSGGGGRGWEPHKPKPSQDQDTNNLYNTTLAHMLYQ